MRLARSTCHLRSLHVLRRDASPDDPWLLKCDAPVNPGMSGGLLVDLNGGAVGVLQAADALSHGPEEQARPFGYAVRAAAVSAKVRSMQLPDPGDEQTNAVAKASASWARDTPTLLLGTPGGEETETGQETATGDEDGIWPAVRNNSRAQKVQREAGTAWVGRSVRIRRLIILEGVGLQFKAGGMVEVDGVAGIAHVLPKSVAIEGGGVLAKANARVRLEDCTISCPGQCGVWATEGGQV